MAMSESAPLAMFGNDGAACADGVCEVPEPTDTSSALAAQQPSPVAEKFAPASEDLSTRAHD